MKLVLLGPPGAGKGTQAVQIVQELKIHHFSTGEALRGHVAEGTELGKEAKAYMAKGEPVPTEIITQMVIEGLDGKACEGGWLLDGYPRNLQQGKILDDYLRERSQTIDAVVSIECDAQVIVDRLSNRRYCPNCGWTCNLQTMPPQKDSICDTCGGSLQQRADDQPSTIRHRLEVYCDLTQPLVSFYDEQGLLLRIPGTGGADEVYTRVEEALRAIR